MLEKETALSASSSWAKKPELYELDSLNRLEFVTIPTFFLIGLVGNTLGAACLLSRRSMRKRTPLFILAVIGITDSVMLASQMMRWIALFYENFLIESATACKFYFMFFQLGVLVKKN
jgi:heme/copper-type cytochrome/quinol oxidase subunit 3